MAEVRLFVDGKNQLGESPLWDPEEQALYWVDSLGPSVWRRDWKSGEIESWPVPQPIGSMCLREGGGAILALANGLYAFDFRSGRADLIHAVEAEISRTRLNDGKVDRRGRFFVGGMDDQEAEALAGLYRLDPDMGLTKLDGGIICSNGPCWSPDDRIFYFADTWKDVIYAYDFDIETGAISNRRSWLSTADQPGVADGMTVDAEGHVWVALVTSGLVRRYAPDGRVERTIAFPVENVTSVMFGGPALDQLFVTSMRKRLPGNRAVEDEAGGVFAVEGLGVRGLPEPRFAG